MAQVIPFLGAFNHVSVPDRLRSDRLLHQAVEESSTGPGTAPIEAKDEFVQIIVQLLLFDPALMDAQEPAFEQSRHTVRPWKHPIQVFFFLLHDGSVSEPHFDKVSESDPAIGHKVAAGSYDFLDEGHNLLFGLPGHLSQSNPSDSPATHFSRHGN